MILQLEPVQTQQFSENMVSIFAIIAVKNASLAIKLIILEYWGANMAKIEFERKGILIEVVDYRPEKEESLVKVKKGSFGTRKEGDLFLMPNKTIQKHITCNK